MAPPRCRSARVRRARFTMARPDHCFSFGTFERSSFQFIGLLLMTHLALLFPFLSPRAGLLPTLPFPGGKGRPRVPSMSLAVIRR